MKDLVVTIAVAVILLVTVLSLFRKPFWVDEISKKDR